MSEDRFKFRCFWKKENSMRPVISFDEHKVICAAHENVSTRWGEIPIEDIILMQSTGIKDKNGKLIYEGDILRVVDPDDKSSAQVVWDYKYASFGKLYIRQEQDEYIFCPFDKIDSEIFEIIGNIYETPNLLKDSDI